MGLAVPFATLSPDPAVQDLPGQVLLPQKLLLPSEHLCLGRGQEAVTWWEGDTWPRGPGPPKAALVCPWLQQGQGRGQRER